MNFRKHDSFLSDPFFHNHFYWSRLPKMHLKAAIFRVCARERFGGHKLKSFYWALTRKKMVHYYERNYGHVPQILKLRRLPKNPFLFGENLEFRQWWTNYLS